MVYPACSDHEWLVTGQEVTPDHDLETEQLHFDEVFERGMRCASGLRCGLGADQKPVANSGDSGHHSVRQNYRMCRRTRPPAKDKKSRKIAKSHRGQQKIDPARAREIQEALIREHYLDGTASGTWDAKSQSRDAALSGGQWLAKQSGPRFPGLDQDGTGPRS